MGWIKNSLMDIDFPQTLFMFCGNGSCLATPVESCGFYLNLSFGPVFFDVFKQFVGRELGKYLSV